MNDKVNLSQDALGDNCQYDHKPDGKPSDYWGIGVVVVYTVYLLSTMEVESSLVGLDLIGD